MILSLTKYKNYFLDLIRSDCLAAKERLGNTSRERIDQVDPSQALTLHDVEVLANGGSLVKYDAMVLYGQDDEDQLFAFDLIERLQSVELKGKFTILIALLSPSGD